MQFRFLGTGTSQGVPVIGCHCAVCTSTDPRNYRFRSSAVVTTEEGKKILLDCGPDFRMQMLHNREEHVDAVLLTHEHNDHIIGLDDLRPLIFRNGKNMPLYCSSRVAREIRERFPYAFAAHRYPGAPSFDLYEIAENFTVDGTTVEIINVLHNRLPVLGFKFKELAYITDASSIATQEKEKLHNLDVLIVNCIRKAPEHNAHFVLPQAISLFSELQPKKMFLTHISHQFGLHEAVSAELPSGMFLAYDGLEFSF